MDHATGNPPTNDIGAGLSEQQVRVAVERSGYPLQTLVGQALRGAFLVQEEWSYVDRDSGDLRSLDLRADMRLHDWHPQPRVRPQLTLLVECKQSQLPYVFFEAERPAGLLDHPKITGLHLSKVTISTDDDPSSWSLPIIHALDLHDHKFQSEPIFSNTFSKCVRKGSEIELSGADAYNGLTLPLVKSLEHLANAEAPPETAWYFDARLSVALGVLDAPIVVARRKEAATELELAPWIRILRHEYSAHREHFERDRLWAIDIVHKDYLSIYLEMHLVPFAHEFAKRVLAHPTELATGQAYVAGMGKNSWHGLETRLRPKAFQASVKRTRAIGRNLLKLVIRKQKPSA